VFTHSIRHKILVSALPSNNFVGGIVLPKSVENRDLNCKGAILSYNETLQQQREAQ